MHYNPVADYSSTEITSIFNYNMGNYDFRLAFYTNPTHTTYTWPVDQNNVNIVFVDDIGTQYNGSNISHVAQLTPKMIVQQWRPSFASFFLKLHPEYCYWQTCDGKLNNSYIYDATVTQLGSYQSAYDNGYLNPTNRTPATQYYGTNPSNQDPLNITTQNVTPGNTYKAYLEDNLDHFIKLPDNSYLSIWEFSAFSVYCGSVGNNYESFACLDAFKNQSVSDDMWKDAGYKEKYLLAFKANYAALKAKMYKDILSQLSGSCWTCSNAIRSCSEYLATEKERRYYFNNFLNINNNFGSALFTDADIYSNGIAHTDVPKGNKIGTEINNKLGADIAKNCSTECEIWMDRLKPCLIGYGVFPESTNPTMVAKWNAIKNDLIYVCSLGGQTSDEMTIYGSSTIPSSYTGSTTNGYRSFEDVLKYHIPAFTTSDLCDIKLLDFPKESNFPYFDPNCKNNCNCDYLHQEFIKFKNCEPPALPNPTYTNTGLGAAVVSLVNAMKFHGDVFTVLKDATDQSATPTNSIKISDPLYQPQYLNLNTPAHPFPFNPQYLNTYIIRKDDNYRTLWLVFANALSPYNTPTYQDCNIRFDIFDESVTPLNFISLDAITPDGCNPNEFTATLTIVKNGVNTQITAKGTSYCAKMFDVSNCEVAVCNTEICDASMTDKTGFYQYLLKKGLKLSETGYNSMLNACCNRIGNCKPGDTKRLKQLMDVLNETMNALTKSYQLSDDEKSWGCGSNRNFLMRSRTYYDVFAGEFNEDNNIWPECDTAQYLPEFAQMGASVKNFLFGLYIGSKCETNIDPMTLSFLHKRCRIAFGDPYQEYTSRYANFAGGSCAYAAGWNACANLLPNIRKISNLHFDKIVNQYMVDVQVGTQIYHFSVKASCDNLNLCETDDPLTAVSICN
ncbi:MAG: hypothetical protein HYZ42_06330, partial [Bacteroidetes bacterium]|nr:hypothetical protein [Bacteroidota bacterium]